MKIKRVINNHVLVDTERVETKTPQGLVIPKQSIRVPKKGKVLKSAIETVPKGSIVHFKRYSQRAEMITKKNVYYILHEDDILGIQK